MSDIAPRSVKPPRRRRKGDRPSKKSELKLVLPKWRESDDRPGDKRAGDDDEPGMHHRLLASIFLAAQVRRNFAFEKFGKAAKLRPLGGKREHLRGLLLLESHGVQPW